MAQEEESHTTEIDSLKLILTLEKSVNKQLEVYSNLSYLLRYSKDSSEAIRVNNLFFGLSKSAQNKSMEMEALKYYADIYEHHGLILKSIDFHEQSLQIALAIEDKAFTCLIYGDLAYTYTNLSDYKTALKYQQKAMEYAGKTNDKVRQSWLYFSLSELLYNINDKEGSYEALLNGYQIALDLNEISVLKNANLKMGDYYLNLTKEYTNALSYYNKATTYAVITNNYIAVADISFEKAKCFLQLVQYDSSIANTNKAIKLWKENGQIGSLPEGFLFLSTAYLYDNQISASISSLDSVNSYKSVSISNDFKMDYHKTSYLIHLAQKDTIKAFNDLVLFKAYEDTLTSQALSESLIEMNVKFETTRKKQEIEKQEIIIEQQSKVSQQKSDFLLVLALVLILVLFLLVWIYYSRKNVQKVNGLLTIQKQEIEVKNAEKEVLLKEIHHRVKNNLQVISSLLNLQSRTIKDESALSAVREGQNRVKSIALIHQKLYQTDDLSEVLLVEYIQQLCGFLKTTFGKDDINVNLHITPANLALDIDTAVPVGLILNELITNAFKYACNSANSSIDITITEESDNHYQMTVKDDGPGLPLDFDVKKSRSLGIRLVRELTKQLKGEVDYSNESGTRFVITFNGTKIRK